MADPLSPAPVDPFADINPAMKPGETKIAAAPAAEGAASPVANDNEPTNPFADLGPEAGPGQSGKVGSFARGAEKGTLPAAGGLAGAGLGAEVGAAAGLPLAPFTGGLSVPVLGFAGGVGGGIFGAKAVDTAQNWAIKHLPDSWQDAIGFGDRQARLDEAQHAGASFLGGLLPYAVTMNPKAVLKDLPENATALQRILAHPTTGRLFGGALMGGMEAGNEEMSKEDLDWRKIAVATVFGTVFNRPNKIGEAITETGASPARTLLGRPHPTLAQAADLRVMGPGITESVFQGTQQHAPEAAQTAQENARAEAAALGEAPEPDLHGIARQMEPETFQKYDELLKRRDTLQSWHGEGTESEAAERHLAATEAEIREMSPEVAAAYRRAADTVGTGSLEAEQFPSLAHMLAAHENSRGAVSHETNLPEVQNPQPAPQDERDTGPVLPAVQPERPEGLREPVAGTGQERAGDQPSAAAGVPLPQRTIGEQRAVISNDVSQKLIAAGRPPEEAEAAGKLIAARYITRAGRFEGKLGTPEELYAREGAAIAGPNGRPQAPAGAMPEPARPSPSGGAAEKVLRGRAAADPKTWSLFEFLAGNGGLKPTADLRSIFGGRNPFVPGFGPLLRESGLSLEDALTRAKENSYVFDPNDMAHTGHDATRPQAGELTKTVNDLHDMIDEESRGRKQYRNDHVRPEVAINPDEERGSIVSALHDELRAATGDQSLKIDPALEDRVVEIIQKEGEGDVLAAYERAIMEDHDRFEGLRHDRQATGHAAGWDAPDSAATPKAGEPGAGDRGQTGLSAEAAREDHGSEPRGAGAHNRETALAQDVEEYFQRVYHGSDYEAGADGKPQQIIPGAEPVSDAELAQRKANEPLKPKVAQKPMESGLFGDAMDQKELFQTARGKIRIAEGRRPIITLMKDANASTMIHETGHQFLEELMRDANHPAAPPQLRDDAQTVRDWLGVTDDIKTRHHEKFARGFEQYLREGVAPSPELAGVFAKFRNWLLSIYQSLKGLGTEISPDIRGVFDRMLEMEPQRTIITPDERPGAGLSLHDIHTADAEHTEPHEAAAVFDRTKAEFDRYVTEPPPEIAREVAPALEKAEAEQAASRGTTGAEPGSEAGAGPGGSSEVVPGGGGPEPVPQSGGVGQGGGQLGGRAGQPAAESNRVPGPDNRAKLGDNPGTALAPGPADLFGPRESPFTDRAGNIRLDNIETSEDIKQAIRDSAAENNDFIGDRRGVITEGQLLNLADALGMDANMLNARQVGQAFNAEQIKAAEKLLQQSATAVSQAMKKAATGTDEDVLAYAEAKGRHQLIQGQFSGITAEAGRALGALRRTKATWTPDMIEGDRVARETTAKTLFQLRAEARLGAELQTPQQVSKFMVDSQKSSFGRILLEYWINGLISGPATHATYMVGNTLSAIMKVPESMASSAIGRAAQMMGREGTRVHAGEAGALIRGGARGIAPALKAGIDALRTGVTTALPGEGAAQAALPFQPGSELAQGAQFDETATFHDAMASAFGLIRGMRDTVISHAALIAAGGVPGESLIGREFTPGRATPNITYRGVTVLPTGALATLPSRGVAVIHSFFRSLVFSMEKNAMAYRKAAEEGLSGTDLHQRVAEIRQDPSEQVMNEAAAHEATESALMGRGSELTQRLASLTNTPIFGMPLLKFIDPFVRVSGNIIDQSLIRRTPVGLLTMLGPETELARDLTGRNGNVAQDKAIGRMMVGTTLAVTFGSLAAQGLLTGSGPKDPKEAHAWMMTHGGPHSIRIGDMTYQVNKLGPIGMLASISADLYNVAHEAEQGEFTKAASHLLHAITQNVLDESAMHGPAELLKAIETPDRYGESYIRNYLAAFVPYSVGLGQMARAADPYQRDTRTLVDAIRNKIPGHLDSYFGSELPVRRDVWGEPVPSRTALGGAGISAIYTQKISSDPVNLALWKLGVFPGSVERKIHNVDLSADQYDDFQRLAGRMAKMRLDKMVVSPQFIGQTPSVQHDWMTEVIKQSRESARQMMMIKNPQIIRQSLEAKQLKKKSINDRDVE